MKPHRSATHAAVCEPHLAIGAAASAVGVSPQTLRVWEEKGLLSPVRSVGGHRLYGPRTLERAHRIARLRRERGWNPAAIATALAARPEESGGPPRSGADIRRARRARGLTVAELADRVGVAAGTVSALERGEAAVSSALVARLADALLVPMGALASTEAPGEAVIRERMRPRTVNAGDVVWEELGAPERALEPALLTVPAGEGSGGSYSRPGDTFAFLFEGRLDFELSSGEPRELELGPGDAITIPGREVFSWSNPGTESARALWVESLLVAGA